MFSIYLQARVNDDEIVRLREALKEREREVEEREREIQQLRGVLLDEHASSSTPHAEHTSSSTPYQELPVLKKESPQVCQKET